MKKQAGVIIFILLNILDVACSSYILYHGGIELMPFAEYAWVTGGTIGLILSKVASMSVIVYMLRKHNRVHLIKPINVGMFVVCCGLLIGCAVTYIFSIGH